MTWITGEDILKLLGWAEFRLKEAWESGMWPYRKLDGARLTPGSKCFNCEHATKERRYSAIGCPRNVTQAIDTCIRQVIKPGIEAFRGHVRKDRFSDGFPADLFNRQLYSDDHDFDENPAYIADAEFIQFVEAQVGPGNLRGMLLESHCSEYKPANENEMMDRLLAAKFKLKDVERYEKAIGLLKPETAPPLHDRDRQVEKSREDFTGPRDHAKYLLKKNPSKGLAMWRIKDDWSLKKFEAAAYVLDRPLPDSEEERRRLSGAWRYHVGLLDQGE